MKKIILLLCLYLIFFSGSAFSKDYDAGNESDKEDSDDYYREMIAPGYGSDKSPAFLNRDDENPNEDSYGYGTPDGIDDDDTGDDSFDSTDTY